MKKWIAIFCALTLLFSMPMEVYATEAAVTADGTGSGEQQEEVKIVLADTGITVGGNAVGTDSDEAVYTSNDIVYYEDRDTYDSGNTYGEGTSEDKHSATEAAEHTVLNITEAGTYRISGTLSKGQIKVDLGENADSDATACVTLILDNVDITCTVAPAIVFYNVYECDGDWSAENASQTVNTSAAGANVIIADGSKNYLTGSHVAKIYKDTAAQKKLWKQDGAFYSYMSMNIDGESVGDGRLDVIADNEGIGSELHLTINGGNINIFSQDDGINTNEDNISVTTINGGNVHIIGGWGDEGDGIDSNGWLVINGGTVIAAANPAADSGLDSDCGSYVNGGTVIALGSTMDWAETESAQPTMNLQFSQMRSQGETIVVTDTQQTVVFAYAPSEDEVMEGNNRNYQGAIVSCSNFEVGQSYQVYMGGTVTGTEESGVYDTATITAYTDGTQQGYGSNKEEEFYLSDKVNAFSGVANLDGSDSGSGSGGGGMTPPEKPGTGGEGEGGMTPPEKPGTSDGEEGGMTPPEKPGTSDGEEGGMTPPEEPGTSDGGDEGGMTPPEKPETSDGEDGGMTPPEEPGTGDGEEGGTTPPEESGTNDGKDAIIREGLWAEAIPDQVYTGAAIKVKPVVYDGEDKLTLNKDYTLKYKNNKKVGTATVVVNGKGNYKGKYELKFNIVAKDITAVGDELYGVLKNNKTVLVKPVVTAKMNGVVKKLAASQYTVEYNYTNGELYDSGKTYSVTVTGKGDYSGSITYPIIFVESKNALMQNAKITLEYKSAECTGEKLEPAVVVKAGGVEVSTDCYTVSYANNINVGNAVVTVKGDNKTLFGSKSISFAIVGRNLQKAVTVSQLPQTVDYTGKAIEPSFVLTDVNGSVLVKEVDYTVAYSKNVNPGNATITITGIGKYAGRMTLKFTINKVELTDANVTVESSVEYTKTGAEAQVKVVVNGKELANGVDYQLSYKNNKKVGNATVTVSGKGGYTGKTSDLPYAVTMNDFDEIKVDAVAIVGGTALKKVKVVVTDNGKKLTQKEYAVSYEVNGVTKTATDIVNVGDVVTVIVTAKEGTNYVAGNMSKTEFHVGSMSIAKAKVKIASQEYTGAEIELAAEDFTMIKVGKDTLVYGEDYKIVGYSNNVGKTNKATVTIEGIGDYCGTKTIKFKIGQRDLASNWNPNNVISTVQNLLEKIFQK